MKGIITKIHVKDSYYEAKGIYIGKKFEVFNDTKCLTHLNYYGKGWYGGQLLMNDGIHTFFKFKFKELSR